ncbi:lasso peptide biosynthesis B2 protein [Hoeflea prorocentri]|uniref:Lasso peptide biosynthesis B2 protein n=1 Tax=Hoeflea prorocentri TaxID=1922333 RepID=A0A9X3UL76_9HYPH|nr:lasso peptide biosynthesis B2 protein [Hoeflea prorocentri]MCY6382616.1 lasso peptide biosynthesis B2 protein [Hoeflea prorocentri]MDA5400416.1 lasso peptide biosynthesis B2 protein [Hoeflea prorocentri]
MQSTEAPPGAQRRQFWRRRLFRLEIWLTARLLPLLLAGRDLTGSMRLADGGAWPRYADFDADFIARAVMRVTRRPWLMRERRCFRQGILGYRFLKKAGYRPELHFGIEAGSVETSKINAHCWVVLNGHPVVNDIMDDMIPIHVHKVD